MRLLFIIQVSLVVFLFLGVSEGCTNSKNEGVKINVAVQKSIQLVEPRIVQEETISPELIQLEEEYSEMLSPIESLKTSHSKMYWFIVSWLKTSYRTPDWTGYYSEEWMARVKQKGIDCSGFSRVMLDRIFDKQVAGGSQGILNHYCNRIKLSSLEMGDLVFFRAPFSTNDRIVHVGVYIEGGYFVHATSVKSAAKGMGLSVNSIEEENWAKEFVTGGRVKE